MMDTTWYAEYLDGHPDEQVVGRIDDPEGWRTESNENGPETN